MHQDQAIEMAGIIFNDKRRINTPPEQRASSRDVRKLAEENGWPVLKNSAYHSDSYPTGSRGGTPIFLTKFARDYVKGEFSDVAEEFLAAVGLR